jgi:hypothetical protein
MKKTSLLTLALAAVSASQVMGVDLYITGSTAFRKQVYQACVKLYDNGAPASTFSGTVATGGDTSTGSSAGQWVMTGTVSNTISALGMTPLTIHGLFTGSVQGLQTTFQGQKLFFLAAGGPSAAQPIVTNTPTIAFSDVDAISTPYTVPSNYAEDDVAVQPFVFTKSVATASSITNLTSGQFKYLANLGRMPLSSWTRNLNDRSTLVYLINRTKDSGTRRAAFAEVGYGYNQSATVYLFDNVTNQTFYKPNGTAIVGSAGNNNANLAWGSGYVGGSNVKTEQGYNYPGNQSIAYLSIGDAQGITSTNWSQVVSFNGVWPTAAGAAISGSTGTNDFSPVALGNYPYWAYEVVDYPTVDPSSLSSDQNLTAAQLGTSLKPGTIMGVLNAQSLNGPTPNGATVTGSIENEIKISESVGGVGFPATALRLSEMTASRGTPGSTITP